MQTNNKALVDAARAVVYGDGPTEANLRRLREALDAVDNAERFEPNYDDEEED